MLAETRTVLEIDLVGYSDVARALDEMLDTLAVKAFEDQIQSFVDVGLKKVGMKREEVVLATAGDNAILVFDDAATMHRMAEAVQQATREYNRSKTVEMARRWFRMGAATGTVIIEKESRRVVGTTIAAAVRLEAASDRGQLLIDAATFDALPAELQAKYGDVERVKGKRDESFQVRRCVMVPRDEVSRLTRQSDSSRFRTLPVVGAILVLGIVLTCAAIWFFPAVPQPSTQPTPENEPPDSSPNEPSVENSAPLSGTINIRLWDPENGQRKGMGIADPSALPVKAGDQIRVEAELNQPAYIYLVWIVPSGEALPVYPWPPGDWNGKVVAIRPMSRISLPEESDKAWPMDDSPGMETLMLLARATPLPDVVKLDQLFAGLPAQGMQDNRSLVWFDTGDILADAGRLRSPQFFNEQQVDDPVLITQRMLSKRLQPYFDVIQAVSFAKAGK